jgi:hypothetical protein
MTVGRAAVEPVPVPAGPGAASHDSVPVTRNLRAACRPLCAAAVASSVLRWLGPGARRQGAAHRQAAAVPAQLASHSAQGAPMPSHCWVTVGRLTRGWGQGVPPAGPCCRPGRSASRPL